MVRERPLQLRIVHHVGDLRRRVINRRVTQPWIVADNVNLTRHPARR